MSEPTRLRWPRLLACLAGGLCVVLGLIVLYGWYTHNLRLLHVYPTFVAMAYNTALDFFLCGASLLAAGLGRPRLAFPAACLGAAVGLLGLSEYPFHVNLGIDELFMKAYTRAGIVKAARMSFSTALCFSLSSVALLLAFRPARRGWRPPVMTLLGGVVMGLAAVALSGYFTGVIRAYLWGQFTKMAIHTVFGFLVLGMGVVALAWEEGSGDRSDAPRRLPILLGLAVATATLCIWQALVVEESAQLDLIRRLEAANAPLPLSSLTRTQSLVPDGALWGGLLLAALLAWAVHLALTARLRAREIEAVNGALRVAREELEGRVMERTAELAQANQALRDVLFSVTEGKFLLCGDSGDLPPVRASARPAVALSRTAGLAELRSQTRQAAADGGLSEPRRHDLETAVGEAAMNAAVHGGGGRGQVCVDATGVVQVWVRDEGAGITMEHLPRATLERGYTTAGTLGHGFWLMLNLVDRLWLLTGPNGTTVVLEQNATPPEPLWLAASAPAASFGEPLSAS